MCTAHALSPDRCSEHGPGLPAESEPLGYAPSSLLSQFSRDPDAHSKSENRCLQYRTPWYGRPTTVGPGLARWLKAKDRLAALGAERLPIPERPAARRPLVAARGQLSERKTQPARFEVFCLLFASNLYELKLLL